MTPAFSGLDAGDEKFVSLTTFRRTGEPVPTTVWIARDGDALVVTTPAGSGKVKRLRHDPRVELRPSTRFGSVADDAPVVRGTAEVLDDEASEERVGDVVGSKYGLEYRAIMGIEGVASSGSRRRVMLRIAPDA
jgi:PPOX class probable F420-dependent enzyme